MEEEAATIVTSLADGATAIASGFVTVIGKLIANEHVLTLLGLAIGYGIVKFTLNKLPMLSSGR